jgi:hypothetical protein
MKRRIAMWASVGFLVACGWVLYTFVVPVEFLQASLRQPLVLAVLYVTCPLSYAGGYFAIHYWWVPPINGATYMLMGLMGEALRRRVRPSLAV